MGLLEGRVAVVTGGAGGLGTIFCKALAAEGASIVVNDLGVGTDGKGKPSISRAQKVVDEIVAAGGKAVANVEGVQSMAGAKKIMQAALDAYDRLDILICSHGIISHGSILEMTEEDFEQVVDIHLKGTFNCVKAAAEIMIDQEQGGRIITNSSLAGIMGNAGKSNYAAAKGGVAGFTLSVALDLITYGITVNCLVPVAYTRLSRDEPMYKEEGLAERFSADKVGPVIAYLSSELASTLTGRVIGVQGNKVFAYSLALGQGVTSDRPWTPLMIHDRIREIIKT